MWSGDLYVHNNGWARKPEPHWAAEGSLIAANHLFHSQPSKQLVPQSRANVHLHPFSPSGITLWNRAPTTATFYNSYHSLQSSCGRLGVACPSIWSFSPDLDGGFFLACEDLGQTKCLTIHLPPVLSLSLFFFFFEVEFSLCTLIPLFSPGSVHSGSVGWDNCGWMFPDKLCVSSFPDRFPDYA